MEKEKSGITVAMVLLQKLTFCPAEVFRRHVQEMLPEATISAEDAENDICQMKIDERTAFVSLMSGPIPWNDLESLTQEACAWHWTESGKVLRNHKGFVLVTMTDAPPDPLDAAILLTKITAGVAEALDALGVYWNGPAICSREMFISEARDAERGGHLPVLAWMSFNIVRCDGHSAIVTQGMNMFNQMELQLLATGSDDVVEMALDMAIYILNGAVLKPGQTFGRSKTEMFPVSHAPWLLDSSKQALNLDMRPSPPKPKGFFGRMFGK